MSFSFDLFPVLIRNTLFFLQVKCMQCSYTSDKFDPFLDLSLEIVKADSLQKALTHFTTKEFLDGGERHYQCQQCKQKVKALKQLTIHKAPYVLTIHLKRFSSHLAGQKIDKSIILRTTLDLKPFVTDPCLSSYRLFFNYFYVERANSILEMLRVMIKFIWFCMICAFTHFDLF